MWELRRGGLGAGGKSTLPRVVDNSQITSEAAGWQCGRSKGASVWEGGELKKRREGHLLPGYPQTKARVSYEIYTLYTYIYRMKNGEYLLSEPDEGCNKKSVLRGV